MDVLEHQRCFLITKRIACTGIFHTHESHDFARTSFRDLFTFFGFDAEDAAHTLSLGFIGVIHTHAVGELAAEDADECLLTYVWVVDEFESQSSERFIFRGVALAGLLLVIGIMSDDRTEILG